jgi:hypothetical protein
VARGFESKAVTDQQEAVDGVAPERNTPPGEAVDGARLARLRRLQLARVDIERHLQTAHAPAHREVLQRALAALDEQMAQVR